ncbi:hypothetical protein [Shewanella sp. MEBiC00475]|uniref:hypothetical protein n=1 Tax=Shewanella sp. MEBiC00475 TaxID=2575361 RepID=UPI0010C0F35B|nr:hypothetical protein [Shewanella sp. MEBiC00475]
MKVNPIIISLTSYAERINVVHLVVESLKKQTYQVDKIVLWLDETELTRPQLPQALVALEDELFEVRFCPNYKSYKKLVPSLVAFSDAHIITFDDDIIIPTNVVEAFVDAHQRHSNAVIASRGRLMMTDEHGAFEGYDKWTLLNNDTEVMAPFSIIPIGYGGVLYPNGGLDSEVINVDQFSALANNADDIWFKCMSLLKHTPTVILPRSVSDKFKVIENTQEIALYLTVNTDDRNGKCLQAIAQAYPALFTLFKSDTFQHVTIDNRLLSQLLSRPNLFDSSEKAVSFFRDAAMKIEHSHLNLAYQLMLTARKYRPQGPLINRKIREYQAKMKQ